MPFVDKLNSLFCFLDALTSANDGMVSVRSKWRCCYTCGERR